MSLKGQIIDISKKTVNSSVSNAINAAESLGTAALHTLIPDDFEYYMCSLELIDCSKKQIGFISFSVMPNNISESKTPIQSQVKTNNGIITLFNDSFCPISISLQGTFGRKFRLVTDIVSPINKTNFFNINSGKLLGTSLSVKTGYGLSRVLKNILDKTNELDKDGNPYILIFKNYSFNTSYVVDIISFSFTQGIENNMLWFYDVQLKAVAPASAVQSRKQNNSQLLKTVASNSIAQGLSNLIGDVVRNNKLSY